MCNPRNITQWLRTLWWCTFYLMEISVNQRHQSTRNGQLHYTIYMHERNIGIKNCNHANCIYGIIRLTRTEYLCGLQRNPLQMEKNETIWWSVWTWFQNAVTFVYLLIGFNTRSSSMSFIVTNTFPFFKNSFLFCFNHTIFK